MLDIKLLRKDRQAIEAKLRTKESDVDLTSVIAWDEKIRSLKLETETLKARRNELSKTVGELKQKKEDTSDLTRQVRDIGERISFLDDELKAAEEKFTATLSKIPNIPMDDVKISHDPKENVIIKICGEKPQFAFMPKNHLELNERLHLLEFAKTAKTTGTGWPAYVGMGARLEWALLSYMIDMQVRYGFQFWLPPIAVRPEIMFGSGQIPKFEGQYYKLADENLYLIPTAEVVLNGMHFDEIIPEERLPIKYAAYTPCFRREAGAAGAQERGLIRVHQFNKVEMFCFTKPEESNAMMEHMVHVAEEILEGLQMHYRIVQLVTGDMSFSAAKTLDIEVWLPGQNRYYEISSISNCTDYQARRSQIRYKGKQGGSPELVHTLNGSGLATSRLLVALLENNQRADGSIHLPPVLQEKLGVSSIIPQ